MDDISELKARVQLLEDRAEITQLLYEHPLAIDAGEGDYWVARWTEDSTVDRLADPEKHSGDYAGVYGKATLLDEINSPELEALRKGGLMHFNTSPSVIIDGDTASATSYTQLVTIEDGDYRARRFVVNRWELRREDGRWQISKRTIRAMGHEMTRSIARGGLSK
jgi:hypothetical protein